MSDVSVTITAPTVSAAIAQPVVSAAITAPTVSAPITSPTVSAAITSPNVSVEIAGAPGPQGPAGPAGGTAVTWPAGQNLSTGRAVIIDEGQAFYFQPSDATHEGRAYGITVTSAITGADVDIQITGERADAAFSFVADTTLWVDDDGEIVNTQPTSGVLIQRAGVASGAKKMIIDFFCIKKN